ncbi:MAG: hypothetical protein MUC31_07610 [Bacteroidales bacterium]|nr:hypothetical protein [Bacteroidales bacterium]
MKRTRITGLFLLLAVTVLLVSSCASNKPPYRQYKPRQKKCDCSRWSYFIPGSITYFKLHEERHTGRA